MEKTEYQQCLVRSFNSKSPPTFYLKSISCFIADGKLIPKLVFFSFPKKERKISRQTYLSCLQSLTFVEWKGIYISPKTIYFYYLIAGFFRGTNDRIYSVKEVHHKKFPDPLLLKLTTKWGKITVVIKWKYFSVSFTILIFFFSKKKRKFTLSLYSIYSLAPSPKTRSGNQCVSLSIRDIFLVFSSQWIMYFFKPAI